jgi:polyketide biosynthesis enoyl-CoA hydratase PksI
MEHLTTLEHPGLLRVTQPSDGVALVQMDDAENKNALSHAMVDALGEVFARLGRNPDVRAIILAGLPEVFSSGASLEVLEDLASGRRTASEVLLPRVLLDCPLPCIAAMAGYGVGGGFALGVAADIVILGRESRYCLNFLNIGFTPGMGTTVLFEHVLSPALAHELMFSGEARLGRDFEGRSGINYILPKGAVLPQALDLAARIAEKPRAAVVALKRALSSPRRQAFEAGRTQEALMHEVSFAQPGIAGMIQDMFAGSEHGKKSKEQK